jgi:hypothetical protein
MPEYSKNQLLRHDDRIIRVLTIDTDVLAIDCLKRTMPQWMPAEDLLEWEPCDEIDLPSLDAPICDMENMTPEQRKVMHERYTLIAPVLPFIHKEAQRSAMITQMAELNNVSKQTIRKYLCLFLTYQRMEVLAPPAQRKERALTATEKNFRWALNKFFYTERKHSLPTAYNLMLQHKYTDAAGKLVPGYPPFHRFKYFYQRHRKEQTALISREGKTNYQRNSRPLLGTIQDFAPSIGTAMLDSTICDVYLVNESNQLVGRPVLTLAVDAYSSLICGYHLSWEGGVYSLQQLMHNVVTDKVAWCQRFGISIAPEEWPVNSLPGVLVTDKGKEYVGNTFEQLTETGVRMVNLPPYRPELKGIVEHAFSLLHSYFLPHLKGKGTIEPDFQERGARDYRKDACLTMDDFEKILLRCILYYNNNRLLGEQVLSKEMVVAGVQPTANSLWRWGCAQAGANLIPIDAGSLKRTLLPRTEGRFTRRGLVVHKQRYRHCEGKFTERYLNGGRATVAYDPDDISSVYLYESGLYTRFELILKVYDNLSLDEVMELQAQQQATKKSAQPQKDQALIDLVASIETIASTRGHSGDVNLKGIRQTHKTEKQRRRSKQ